MATFLRCHSGTDDNECPKIESVGQGFVIPRRPKVLELAKQEKSESLTCFICEEIFNDPVSTAPCGHVFCRKCIEEQIECKNHECPECSTPLMVGILHKSGFVQKQVNALEMYCENGVSYDILQKKFTVHGWHGEGCQAVVTNANYDAHVQTCMFTLVACPFGVDGCPVVIERGGLEAHTPICEFRSEICKCGEKVLAFQQAEHVQSCSAAKIPCPHNSLGCEAVVMRSQLAEHLKTCPVESAQSDLHVLMAEKVRKECFSEALKKMEALQINPKKHDPESRRLFSSLEEETVRLFESKTKNIPDHLRGAVKEKLLVQLSGESLDEDGTSVPSLRSTKSMEERTVYSPDQMLEITGGFAESNLLGRGGFGSVYKGELYGTAVAVKKLHEGGNTPEFQFEVEVLRQIRHPHIVLLMGCCPENGCIVSEFLPGGSLDDRLKGSGSEYPPLTWVDRLRVMSEVSSALLYMHKNDVLHRDLKPANILLDGHNTSKLADMGLAKLFDRGLVSMLTSAKGTAGYLDPHQLLTGRLSHTSDIYSFGLIMFQLIVGQRSVKRIHALLDSCPPSFGGRDLGNSSDIFLENLDTSAGMWGEEHAQAVIQLALRCIEKVPKKRPNLDTELQPALSKIYHAAMTGEPLDIVGPGWGGFTREGLPHSEPEELPELSTSAVQRTEYSKSVANESFENLLLRGVRAYRSPLEESQDLFDKVKSLEAEGKNKLNSNKYTEALAKFNDAIQILPRGHPEISDLHSLKAACLLQMSPVDYSEVLRESDSALAIDPSSTTALLHKAIAHEGLQDFPMALKSTNALLLMDTSNEEGIRLYRRIKKASSAPSPSPSSSDKPGSVFPSPASLPSHPYSHSQTDSQPYLATNQPQTHEQPYIDPNQAYYQPYSNQSQPQILPSGYEQQQQQQEQSHGNVQGQKGEYGGVNYGSPSGSPAGSVSQSEVYPNAAVAQGEAQSLNGSLSSGGRAQPSTLKSLGNLFSTRLSRSVPRGTKKTAVKQAKDHGDQEFSSGNFQNALQSYETAITYAPGEPDRSYLRGQLGACLLELSPPNYTRAIKELSASLAAQPGNVSFLLKRAKAYVAVGDITRAATDIKSLLVIEPFNQEAQKLRSEIELWSLPGGSSSFSPASSKSSSSTAIYAGVHFHYTCDQCGTTPICGYRYESLRKRNHNLCPGCVANQSQASTDFRAIPPPEDSNGAFLQSLGYPNGICTIGSEQQRVDLLLKASEAGNVAAICELGLAYQTGKGLPKDLWQAVQQFTLASYRSYPYAQFLLGKAYLEGQGTSVDMKKARDLMESAANGGQWDAQLELAECMLTGKGGPENVPDGIKWLKIAVEGGHSGAQRRLARCYSEGFGVPRDYAKASDLYQKCLSNS